MLRLPLHHSDDPSRLHHHPTRWPLPIHSRLRHWDFLLAHSHGSLRSSAQTRNLETIQQLNAALMLPSRPHKILTPLRSYTLSHRSPSSRLSPAVAAVSSPGSSSVSPVSSSVSSPSRPRHHRHRFSSRPHHLFNVFLKVCHRKISQCSPNKDGGRRFEYRHITLQNHCT